MAEYTLISDSDFERLETVERRLDQALTEWSLVTTAPHIDGLRTTLYAFRAELSTALTADARKDAEFEVLVEEAFDDPTAT